MTVGKKGCPRCKGIGVIPRGDDLSVWRRCPEEECRALDEATKKARRDRKHMDNETKRLRFDAGLDSEFKGEN